LPPTSALAQSVIRQHLAPLPALLENPSEWAALSRVKPAQSEASLDSAAHSDHNRSAQVRMLLLFLVLSFVYYFV
jgi:hypothetical protein